jgi:hypothetical protein
MIGKVPRAGTGFRGVVSYLMRGKRDAPDPNRVAWAETRNLPVIDPDRAPTVMRATANQSVRCQRPVYHFVISWHEAEAPSDDIMRMVGNTTLADLQLDDHQAILIAHTDTSHKHLHVVVNRVHPETCRAWSKDKDWARLEISLGRQAKKLGLLYVPGRHNDPAIYFDRPLRPRDGDYQAAFRHDQPIPRGQWSKDQFAARREHLAAIFDHSPSWDNLADELAGHGLHLERKGQGIIIGDETGYLKLSSLRKDIRLKALEERYLETFGDFDKRRAESDTATQARYEQKPTNALVPPHKRDAQPRSTEHDQREPSDERLSIEAERDQRHARTHLRPEITEAFARAVSWDNLEALLNQSGVQLDRKGKGIILLDEHRHIKLASLGAHIDIPALEQRYIETFADYTARCTEQLALEKEQQRLAQQQTRPHATNSSGSNQDDPPASDAGIGSSSRHVERAQPMPDQPQDNGSSGRVDAHQKLERAREALDMAHAMSKMGIATDLDAARRDLEAAQADLDRHLTVKEKLDNQLRDVFTPEPEQQVSQEDRARQQEERRRQRLLEAAKRDRQKKDRDDHER